jgi:hypothetical protein
MVEKTITLNQLYIELMLAKDQMATATDFHPDDKITLYYPQVTKILSDMVKRLETQAKCIMK